VEKATSKTFANYFSEKVWKKAGSKYDGAWLVNNLNQTSTFQGFSARPHDWIRLGILVLNEINKGESCISRFLIEMSTPKIDTGFNYYKKYGYQTLIPNEVGVDFAFQGYYGQFLLFNREKNMVLFHHATNSNLMGRRTFKAMEKLVKSIEIKN
jgi:CubicO group peptidase (beta-lactamase class C family)